MFTQCDVLLTGDLVERLGPLINMRKVVGSVLAHNRTLSKLGRTLSEIMYTYSWDLFVLGTRLFLGPVYSRDLFVLGTCLF